MKRREWGERQRHSVGIKSFVSPATEKKLTTPKLGGRRAMGTRDRFLVGEQRSPCLCDERVGAAEVSSLT